MNSEVAFLARYSTTTPTTYIWWLNGNQPREQINVPIMFAGGQRIEGSVIDALYLDEKGMTIVAYRFPVE